jgi:hypothetical protein
VTTPGEPGPGSTAEQPAEYDDQHDDDDDDDEQLGHCPLYVCGGVTTVTVEALTTRGGETTTVVTRAGGWAGSTVRVTVVVLAPAKVELSTMTCAGVLV